MDADGYQRRLKETERSNIMIAKIDADGRVQIPPTIRYRLDLNAGDRIVVDHLGDGTIIMKKIAEMNA